MDLDQVLNGTTQEPVDAAPPNPPVVTEEPKGDAPAPVEPLEAGAGEPPAPAQDKNVPLSALEAVRREKTDWKEKAVRLEEQLKAAKERDQQPGNQQQPASMTYEDALVNERLNMSEMMLRSQHDDVDKKIDRFKQEADRNPALGAELRKQTHPYKWAYEYASRLELMDEIGTDPNAYRERLREQVKAELAQQSPSQDVAAPAAPAARIPQSLASAHSVGARTASTWTGPTPLDNILKPQR